MVDVVKHIETGIKYIIPHGDPLPSSMYVRIRENITYEEATKYIPKKLNPKQR